MRYLSVIDAAAELDVGPSHVRKMLRAGTLRGTHIGRAWVISDDALEELRSRRVGVGRPLAQARAWGLLEMLEGGDAAWLSMVARSQVRAQMRRLRGADAFAWRTALRGREDRYSISGHRAAIERLSNDADVWLVHPAATLQAGVLEVESTPEFYVARANWERLAAALHLRIAAPETAAYVRVARIERSFSPGGPGRAVLAACLLDHKDWRVAKAGADALSELAEKVLR